MKILGSISILFMFILTLRCGLSARILGVYPVPSISHQIVFRVLTKELARLGHELVVLTTDPAFKDDPHPNVTEIDTHENYGIFLNLMSKMKPRLGVYLPPDTMYNMDVGQEKFVESMLHNNTEVDKLIKDKNQKFDLVIGEAYFYLPLRLAMLYNAPAIWLSSYYGSNDNYEAMGAPFIHPDLYPHFMRFRHYNLTIWERLWEYYEEWRLVMKYNMDSDSEVKVVNKYFGGVEVTKDEMKDVVDMVLLNVNPTFQGNRPVPPNIVYLGGLHMKPIQQLPQDLQSFMDASSRGVVFVSFGTNVHTQYMDRNLLEIFLKAFESLPYDVMWKFTGDLPWKPENLMAREWFPQRDILAHPNVKAFVMQGGLQSTDEAIDSGVPLVGIPMFADQGYNVDHYLRLGIGVRLDVLSLTPDKLVQSVHEVIENDRYRKNIRALTPVFRAHSASALQRAVSAVDTVLQTGGRHLRPATAGMTWTTYLMLDVVAVLSAILFASLAMLYVTLKTVIRLISKMGTTKTKIN